MGRVDNRCSIVSLDPVNREGGDWIPLIREDLPWQSKMCMSKHTYFHVLCMAVGLEPYKSRLAVVVHHELRDPGVRLVNSDINLNEYSLNQVLEGTF